MSAHAAKYCLIFEGLIFQKKHASVLHARFTWFILRRSEFKTFIITRKWLTCNKYCYVKFTPPTPTSSRQRRRCDLGISRYLLFLKIAYVWNAYAVVLDKYSTIHIWCFSGNVCSNFFSWHFVELLRYDVAVVIR